MLNHSVLLPSNGSNTVIVFIVADPGRKSFALRGSRAHLARRARQVSDLARQPRHERVFIRIVFLFF